MTGSLQLAVGVVDRTEELFDLALDAAERAGLAVVVEELEPTTLGPASPREDVMLLGPRELTAAGLRRAVRYAAEHPACVLIAVGLGADGPSRAELRGYGIQVSLRGTVTRAKLATALTRAADELDRLRADTRDWAAETDDEPDGRPVHEDEPEPEDALEDALEPDPEPEPGPLEPVAEEPEPAVPLRERAAVLTVASATGGCGKTFFATNLAAIVAKSGHRCLLVDLDLQFGEVAAALRVRHPYSVYDGLYDAEGHPLPASDLAEHFQTLVAHHPLGFDVLTAPRDPALADYVGARDASHVLDVVERHYDVVVVDTPPSLNEVVLTALDRSDVVTVLATLDVPSLKNLTVFLDTLGRLRIDRSALRLVLNKVENDIGISVAQAQEAFDGRFVGIIPLSRGVSRAINAGTVVVETEPRTPVVAGLRAAAAAALPDDLVPQGLAAAPSRPSILTRLLAVLRGRRAARATGGTP